MPRPSLAAVAALAVGMALARAMEWTSPLIAIPVAVAACAVGFHPARRLAALLAAFAAAGIALQAPLNDSMLASRRMVAAIDSLPGRSVEIEGRMVGEPGIAANGIRFLVGDVALSRGESTVRLPAKMMVRVPATTTPGATDWRASTGGDLVRVTGLLRPAVDRPAPGTYDHWLASQGAVGEVRASAAEFSPGSRGPVASFRIRMQGIADAAEATLRASLDPAVAAVMDAMLLGRTHLLSADQRDAFQRNGLVHLFSVSGLHAGIVGVMVAGIATMFGAGPRWRSVAVVAGLVAFCALTGFRAPAIRASLLTTIFFLQPLLRREIDPLGALASVALAMVALRPSALWQLDFQLSFLCAITLVLAAPGAVAFEEWAGRTWLRGRWSLRPVVRIVQCLFVTVALQLALVPFLALHFGQVSIVAPVANGLMLPTVPFAMGLGFAGVALHAVVPEVAALLFRGLDVALSLALPVVESLSAPSWAAIPMLPWPPWLMGLWYAALLSGKWLRLRPRFTPFDGAASAASGIAVAIVFLLLAPRAAAPNALCVDFVDVGQGDAVLVRTRDGATMLVDTGPPRAPQLLDHLRTRGVDRIDVLVLTHADADHIGGAGELLETVPVGVVCTGGTIADTETWSDVASQIRRRGIATAVLRRGSSIKLAPQVSVDVLHPTDRFAEEGDDRNEGSVVLRVSTGSVSFLLTGDAEGEAERDMLAAVAPELVDCDVLKAGHHGSRHATGAELLAAATPDEVVVSCGRGNRYGHPANAVLGRCAEAGAAIRRTDREGTVGYGTDGGNLFVQIARDGSAAPEISRRSSSASLR